MALHRIEFTWFHYSITCTFFLLHLSSPVARATGWRLLAAMLPYGARTFLPDPDGYRDRGDKTAYISAKIGEIIDLVANRAA